MAYQQFKIRMSVSTKLLLVITVLLATPIFFLNVSAVSLFKNDKKAYVYDSQATAAVLAGREFVTFVENALGTLKLIAGTLDVSRPISEQSKKNIEFYLQNQNALLGAEAYSTTLSINGAAADFSVLYRHILPTGGDSKVDPNAIRLDPALFKSVLPIAIKQGYAFRNISRSGLPPMIAVFLADRRGNATKFSVVVGYVTLAHFASGTSSFSTFVIADRLGKMLFNSELKLLYANLDVAADEIFKEAWAGSVKSGAKEYVSPEGVRLLGSYYKPGLDLVALSQIEYDKAMAATQVLTEKFVVLALVALGVMIIIGLVFAKRLTAPLKRLFKATGQVAAGDFNVNIPITSRDEFGALTNSFMAMSARISDLLHEMVDKVRVDQEVEIARTVQQSLFPPNQIENDQLKIGNHYQSASECGGDWLGYFRAGNKHTFIIADATGHGLPSALMTASCRSCFSVIEKLVLENRFAVDPGAMLSVANRVVFDSAQGKIMMTCFVGVLDFDTHTLHYASAAHNPPWLFVNKGEGKPAMQSLVASGQRLGEVQELQQAYESKSMSFKANDTLVLYTDGLLEGKNPAGEMYGKKRARTALESGIGGAPTAIIEKLIRDFMQHNTDKPLDDDVTLSVARILA